MSATSNQQQQQQQPKNKYQKEQDQQQTLTQMNFFEKKDNADYDNQRENAVNSKKVHFHDNEEECSTDKQDENGEIIRDDKGHIENEYMGTQTQELVEVSTETRKIYTTPPTKKHKIDFTNNNRETNSHEGAVSNPTPGTKQMLLGIDGPIMVISPFYKEKEYSGFGYVYSGNTEVYMSSSRLKQRTVVPMRRYINYLLDEEYIVDSNAQVNGRITRWRLGTLDLLDAVKMQGLFLEETYIHQYNWANTNVLQLQAGLAKVRKFPVDILNSRTLMEVVEGVDDEELADFLYRMANCKQFCLIAMPYPQFRGFDVITRFDKDQETKTAYGKEGR